MTIATVPHLTDADRAACKLAIDLILGNPANPQREQICDKLRDVAKGSLDADDPGEAAAYSEQVDNLGLTPAEQPPMFVPRDPDVIDMILTDPNHRAYRGARVLKTMLQLGISPYHPNPIVAIKEARAAGGHDLGDNVLQLFKR